MNTMPSAAPAGSAVSIRLSRLAQLDASELNALKAAERNTRRWPARREIVTEGTPIHEGRAILSGWACRQRILSDGRRQILSFLLPGDLIGVCSHSNPVAWTSILAVTDVVTCLVPDSTRKGLAEAYAVSAALNEYYLLAHITRLGRLSASQRLADWLLETQERLMLAGVSTGDQLPLPLTQEFLADTLGLTSVHVNRTLQSMTRDGLLAARRGMISLLDRQRIFEMVDFEPAHIAVRNDRRAQASNQLNI